ncbi:MAG: hypothetical protein H7Y41_03450, partial [Hyphomonadaceae bacterium]|nr:hypothetical protein [Clostridia bacterium]
MQTNFKIFLLHKNFLFWSTVYVLMVTRFSYFGFTYSPVLDDNNLFGIFHLRLPHVWQDIILHYKTYMIRPVVQSLIDPMVIAPLWQNPFLVLCLITGLHLLSCIILQNILRQVHVRFEAFAIVIFALAPFSSEGTYWIAASSRIIIGLFVCVLSVYLLMRAIKHQNNKLLCIAMLCNLVAMGFYEQIICFNAFFTFVILFLNIKDIQKKWIVILPFVNLAIILAYYAYFVIHN